MELTGQLTLSDLLIKKVVIADGAMGTMLYQHGVFVNTCYDELNLTRPDLIGKIHTEYVQAGADFIETNTFGANPVKLAQFGLAEKTEQINEKAVEIAKNSAGTNVLVAGAIGPLTSHLSNKKTLQSDSAKAFIRQAESLARAGADFLILETFSNLDEMLIAIDSIGEVTDLSIIAQLSVTEENETAYGNQLQQAISRISKEAVAAVGLNCSIGPSSMLDSLKLIKNLTDKPISLQPNAGLPQQVNGRLMYMCTPEYMAEYAKRFFENGAKIIGGCCGTTPAHIKEIARTLKPLGQTLTPSQPKTSITFKSEQIVAKEPVPLKGRSRLGKKLISGERIISIEISPPKGIETSQLLDKASLCSQMSIDTINIPDGPRASSRLSAMITAVTIQQNVPIETILHFCCRDKNLISIQSDLLGAQVIGIRNLLLITGDPPKIGEYPDASGVFDLDSVQLTAVVNNLNRGIDIARKSLKSQLSFTIGVGVNPVASNFILELDRFSKKVEAGAEYAITQPVFDTQSFFKFLEATESFGVPVIAGIWPFTSYKNAEFMANEVPGVFVPDEILEKMYAAKDRQQAMHTGIEIARGLIEKIDKHTAGFALSAPFGNVKIPLAVLGKIDISKI
jgi:methionine synthase I (cobalamin-dependent)/5,10-methylenetetrahydrofolate reductase